jgi:ubiquinone/menaquinone biosynthesis C-methylase UbiE
MRTHTDYIPALGYDWLTPLYDPFLRWVLREETFKRHLVAEARVQPGHRVLDVGCGTGTLTILLKQTYPAATVIGVDIDPKVLALAQMKAARAGVVLALQRATAFALPYASGTFARVLSSLVLHHLTPEHKQQTLAEVFRILQPGGEVYVVDFGKPHTRVAAVIGTVLQRFEEVADHVAGRLPHLFRNAGFVGVAEAAHFLTPFGTLTVYQGRKP